MCDSFRSNALVERKGQNLPLSCLHVHFPALVRAAFFAAADLAVGPLVRAAFFAAAERSPAVRLRAAPRACLPSAVGDAAEWPSCSSALCVARERVLEMACEPSCPTSVSRSAFLRVSSDALSLGGGKSTPARRAFERPIAIACFADRAPCLPSRT